MAYSYKGSISFGLVYIPVTLHNAVKENNVPFHMIDKNTLSRVRYQKTCEDCGGKEVKQEDIVKGYEYDEGKYVIFDDKDFEKIKTKKDKNITIEQFVNLSEIDPVYFHKCYYVVPTGAEKAFGVLLCAMEEEGKAAIAKTVLGTKETLIAIRSKAGQMLLNTLYFHEEILKNPAAQTVQDGEKEMEIAKTIIENMTGSFEPERYRDEYRGRVIAAIEQKIAGKEIVSVKEKSAGVAIDLMEALQKSLLLSKKKPAPEGAKSVKKRASQRKAQ